MQIIIYSKNNCPNCEKAKALVVNAGYTLHVKNLGEDISRESFLKRFNKAKTVPQIEIDHIHIGGFTQLEQYLATHPPANMNFDEDF